VRPVFFDPLAAAAAEAVLAAFEPGVDVLAVNLEAGRKPVEDCRQARPMGLTAGEQSQPSHGAALWTMSRVIAVVFFIFRGYADSGANPR